MPLNLIQLKFLQDHVLRRNHALGAQALDLATDPELASAVSAKREMAIQATAQQYRDLLLSLATPVKADAQEILSLESYRDAFRKYLKPPLTEFALVEANAQLQALDAAIKRCEQRITGDAQTLLRKVQVLSEQKLALQQLAAELLPQDRTQIDQLGQAIALLTTADLPGIDDLAKAENAVLLLRKAIEDALLHVVEDKKRRETERAELRQDIETALVDVDAEVQEPEKSTIPLDAEKIKITLLELPSDDALGLARKALDELKKLILAAGTRAQEDRSKRTELKRDVLKRVADAKLSNEATGEEASKGVDLSAKVTSLLSADPPTSDALGKAEEALKPFLDFVTKTHEDITSVRKVRFALALKAGENFKKLAVESPTEHPAGKPELNEAHEQLEQDLKPFLDWAQVTTWDTPALALVAKRIEPLGLLFENFRQEVAIAIEAIRIASEAATKAVTSPTGEAFSPGQNSHFTDALGLLVIDAKKVVLAAAPHIERIKTLQKQVEAVARVRNELLKRLKLLPTAAPATATSTEQKRWLELRSAAARAADEVVDA